MSTATPDRSRTTRPRPPAAAVTAIGSRLDYPLLAILATLVAVGLIEVWSASFQVRGTYYFVNQIGWVLIGVAVLVVMTLIPYRTWQRLAVPLMAVTLLLLIGVLLFGQDLYGARRTLFHGRIQPSEFTKLTVTIYVAAWVASKKKHLSDVKAGLVPFAIVMGVVSSLIVMEKSFSVTVIILITGVTIFFLGGGDIKQLLVTGAIAALVLLLLVYRFHYGVTRIQDWWQAVTDPSNLPYTLAQVRAIIQRGGGIGTRPENWINKDLVPLLWSDYLFANLAADFKFVGAVAVVVLFAALGYRGLSIALTARDQFGALAGIGITTWILTQAVIHMGASVALIPATGIPLPFMSYGGSAMVACMAGMGLLLSISRAATEKKAGYETFPIGWRNGRARLSDPGRGAGSGPPPGSARRKDPGSKKAGQRSPGKASSGQRRPASGASGRWRPRTREEDFTIDNDWRSRIDDRRLPKRRPPAPRSGPNRR